MNALEPIYTNENNATNRLGEQSTGMIVTIHIHDTHAAAKRIQTQ
jgi:hypothetical protein